MVLEDIDYIYNNKLLRPLVTVPPIGEKFGVVIDEEGNIRGGATGYTENEKAVIQKIIVENTSQTQNALLKEALIRSVIYILERHGVKKIFIDKSEEEICRKIGFEDWEEENKGASILYIDTEKFFENPCCCRPFQKK